MNDYVGIETNSDDYPEFKAMMPSRGRGNTMQERVEFRSVSMASLVAYVDERVGGEAWRAYVRVSGGVLSWERPQTEAERQHIADWEARQQQRHVEWQKRMMRDLIDEYGPDTSTWPAVTSEELAEWRSSHNLPRK